MTAASSSKTLERRRVAATHLLSRHAMLGSAVVLALAFAASSPMFGTLANAANIARQTASVLVLGLGATLVVLVGGIDLSVGSVVLASATVAGAVLSHHAAPVLAVLAAVGTGAAVGAINAAFVEGLRISPVIVTLGSMIAVRGGALLLLGAYRSWIDIDAPIFDQLARAKLGPVPLDGALAFALAALMAGGLAFTIVGRRLRASGDAPAAARLAGLHVRRLRAGAYVGAGALSGVAGVLVAARTGVVSPSVGLGLEFYAIAVVALGAGGLPAGRVKVGQTVVGALILMMVFDFMTIRGVPGTWQTSVTGALLLVAMLAGRLLGTGQAADATVAAADPALRESRLSAVVSRASLAVVTGVLALVFSLLEPSFATPANLVALVEQNAALAIVAVGAMMGIVSRMIDISPGSVVALGAVIAALALGAGAPAELAVAAGVAACLAVYAANGVIVGTLGLDPLIVTLAAWIWARGLAVSLTGARTLAFDPGFVAFLTTPALGPFTPATGMMVVAYGLGWLIFAGTPFGLRLYALGGDPKMLRQAGVDVRAMRVKVLVVMGGFTAAGMLVMLGRLGAAAPTAGFGLELDAIVAVIVGGAAFQGGSGRLSDTAIGVLFLAVLNNGLSSLQMGDAGFYLLKGGAILLALALRAGSARVTRLAGRTGGREAFAP